MNLKVRNKIAGAVYGFAIGDAMGATTEHLTKEQIKEIYGKVTDIIGGGWLRLEPGDVTDDTQMSICVMNALMNSDKPDPMGFSFMTNCRKEFIEWHKTNPRGIGNQCNKAIIYMRQGHLGAPQDINALGNGSLMRVMPCAVLGNELLNEFQGRMTHNNLECVQGIQDYSRLIQNYINGKNLNNEIKSLLEPTGYLWNTFNNCVYWSNQETFEEAIIGAVNDGGDADTIAALAGGLAGARFGYNAIPKKWICQLNDDIKNVLNNFINFAFTYLQI